MKKIRVLVTDDEALMRRLPVSQLRSASILALIGETKQRQRTILCWAKALAIAADKMLRSTANSECYAVNENFLPMIGDRP